MQDAIIVAEEKRTWQETAYLIASVVMVLHGVMWAAVGLGVFDPIHYDGFAFFAYVGVAGLVLGVGLYRCEMWAWWVARVVGIIALITYGRWSLSFGLSVGVVSHAVESCLFCAAWFLYWAFLEYLIWVVAD